MEKKKVFKMETINGYDFFEVSSAFQKSIRRCDEREAMFWALELYQSNYAKYVWKRMIIMASEDVGMAEVLFPTVIMALKQMYDYLVDKKDKHKPEKLPFIQAVVALANAQKSRYIDLAISVYENEHRKRAGKHQIPDYALDMHTRKGKRMGRGLDYFYTEGAKINNTNKMPKEEEFEKIARTADKEMMEYERMNKPAKSQVINQSVDNQEDVDTQRRLTW